MSYNARVRAKQNRARGLYGCDRGWEVGSDQSGAIGIPYRLRRQISDRTRPICYINGVKRDDRNLVVQQNTLSGVGRYRTQFVSSSDGIKSVRYYIGDEKSVKCIQGYLFADKSELLTAVNDWCNPAKKADALEKYGDINTWDVSQITDMSYLFSSKSNFNDDISCWNVGSVTDMTVMFWGATAFNQDIGGWNVSSVTDMDGMFDGATAFNQDIGE